MELKLTPSQRTILMNDAIHYDVSLRLETKTMMYICECSPQAARRIKELVDGK